MCELQIQYYYNQAYNQQQKSQNEFYFIIISERYCFTKIG